MTRPDLATLLKNAAPGVSANVSLVDEAKAKRKPTRGNIRCEADGIWFDSMKERDRYIDLKMLLKSGTIADLKMQVGYELNEGGKYSYKYIADFVYCMDGAVVVEDVKAWDKKNQEYLLTPTFKKKRKLMKRVYGIDILVTGK